MFTFKALLCLLDLRVGNANNNSATYFPATYLKLAVFIGWISMCLGSS